jgi:hypothetical protein
MLQQHPVPLPGSDCYLAHCSRSLLSASTASAATAILPGLCVGAFPHLRIHHFFQAQMAHSMVEKPNACIEDVTAPVACSYAREAHVACGNWHSQRGEVVGANTARVRSAQMAGLHRLDSSVPMRVANIGNNVLRACQTGLPKK